MFRAFALDSEGDRAIFWGMSRAHANVSHLRVVNKRRKWTATKH